MNEILNEWNEMLQVVNEILQVITPLMFGFSFLAFSFFLTLEEREVPSPQRSQWYFRPGSSGERGWAGSRLLGPLEDRRCSDGSALRGRPGTICDSARRPPDANSQRYDFYSGCSHSWSLANSISAAPFCRWAAFAHLSHQNSSSSFLLQNPLLVASIWMLLAFKEPFLCHFALVGWNPVCQTQVLESWPPLPSASLQRRIWKDGQNAFHLYFSVWITECLGWKGF